MNIEFTEGLWSAVHERLTTHPFPLNKDERYIVIFLKEGGHFAYKGLMLVATLIAALVTPIFLLFDLIWNCIEACLQVFEIKQGGILPHIGPSL